MGRVKIIIRHGCWLMLAVLIAAPATALAQDASPVATPVAVAPLDLAAMTLTPDDLADAGLTDYLIADGRTQSLEDRIAAESAEDGDAPAETRRFLSGMGWTRGYRSRLAHPIAAAGEDFDAIISSGVIQFADGDGARTGWGFISQLDAISGAATAVVGSRTIGDRSQLLDLGTTTGDDGLDHPGSRLIFQHGALVGDLVVYSPADQPLPTADLEALAERQLERMDDVLAGGGPGLSFKILRVQGIGLNDPDLDNYRKLDGTLSLGLGDTDEDVANDTEDYQDASDWYRYEAAITDTLFQFTSIAQFPTTDVASAWVQDAFARTDRNRTPDSTLDTVADAPSFGDESVVLNVTAPFEGGEAIGYAVFARFGDQAIGFAFISLAGLALDDVTAIAAVQAACFEAGNCAESVPLPAS